MPRHIPDVIGSGGEALLLLTESALSTVAHIVWRKDGSRAERLRRIEMAQAGIAAIIAAGLDATAFDACIKAAEVCTGSAGSVRAWAQQISPDANLRPYTGTTAQDALPVDAAIVFMTDAMLATLEEITPRKATSRSEKARIVGMAQIGVDWIRDARIVLHGRPCGARICEINDLYCGKVDVWMEQFSTRGVCAS